MATELTVQSERAFQKQPHIFQNPKTKSAKSKRVGKGGRRWYKDVGLGFRTPKTAIDGTYIGTCLTEPIASRVLTKIQIDKKCPFRSSLHSRANSHWHRHLYKNASNTGHPSRIPPFHPQILEIREAPQKSGSSCQPSISSRGRRSSYCWTMQTFEQDG